MNKFKLLMIQSLTRDFQTFCEAVRLEGRQSARRR